MNVVPTYGTADVSVADVAVAAVIAQATSTNNHQGHPRPLVNQPTMVIKLDMLKEPIAAISLVSHLLDTIKFIGKACHWLNFVPII